MKGKVVFIKKQEGKKPMGILIDGTWYNTFDKEHQAVSKGDLIEFEYETSEKGFNNLTDLKIIEKVGKNPYKQEIKDTQTIPFQAKQPVNFEEKGKIIRQNSLSQANQLLSTLQKSDRLKDLTNEQIRELLFRIAEQCEDWVNRKV